jgi:hypothetical protein
VFAVVGAMLSEGEGDDIENKTLESTKKIEDVIKRFYFIVSSLERFRVGDVIWVEICTVVQKRV